MTKKLPIWAVLSELALILAFVIGLYAFWQVVWTETKTQPLMAEAVQTFQESYPAEIDLSHSPEKHFGEPPSVGSPAYGETYAVMHVPKWSNMQIPVSEGTSSSILDLGHAGHYVTTAQVGEIGNFGLAGHRRSYGSNFRRVDIMDEGDPIIIETKDAWIVYEVIGHEIVAPTDSQVLYPVPNDSEATPTKRLMTMTTCHPEYGNSERFVLYSEMKYWTLKSDGAPEALGVGE